MCNNGFRALDLGVLLTVELLRSVAFKLCLVPKAFVLPYLIVDVFKMGGKSGPVVDEG